MRIPFFGRRERICTSGKRLRWERANKRIRVTVVLGKPNEKGTAVPSLRLPKFDAAKVICVRMHPMPSIVLLNDNETDDGTVRRSFSGAARVRTWA